MNLSRPSSPARSRPRCSRSASRSPASSPSVCCRWRRCRRSISRRSRCRPRCRARAPRRWRRPSRRRSSAHSARIAGVTEMTSSSSLGIDARSRCSSASTATSTAPRATCRRRSTPRAPTCRPRCRSNPTYRKVNPADAPILILALTSDTLTQRPDVRRRLDRAAQKLSQVEGVGQVRSAAARCRRCASSSNRTALFKLRHRARGRARRASPPPTPTARRARSRRAAAHWQIYANDQASTRRRVPPLVDRLPQRRGGAALRRRPRCVDSVQDLRNLGLANGKPGGARASSTASRAPTSSRRSTA